MKPARWMILFSKKCQAEKFWELEVQLAQLVRQL